MGGKSSKASSSVDAEPLLIRRNIKPGDAIENLENVALIWLDNRIGISCPDIETTLPLLQELNNFIMTYTDPKLCVEFIKSVDKEKVLLIVSGSLSRNVLPDIHNLRTLDSIFIFCSDQQAHERLKQDYTPKVIDIFTDVKTLCNAIRHQLHLLSKQIMAFSFFNQKQISTKELTKEAASFLWFQMMFSVLKQLPQTPDSKKQMLQKCIEYHRGNERELENIERFRRDYKDKDAIAWYTEESFVFRLVNKALRTEDVDGLYLFRFYIIDLCKQLQEESRNNVGTMTLYRGQVMSDEDLARLKRSDGTLISTNGFFSTTLSRSVAMKFLERSKRHGLQQVLFQITADSSVKHVTFAYIEKFSRIIGEDEVLFNIGAVFKIETVEDDETLKCWIVKMKVTDEETARVQEYIESIKKENEDLSAVILFGHLLTEMGELFKAEKYFNFLLRTAKEDSLEYADIQDEIGHIFHRRSQTALALNHYKCAYEIRKKLPPSNHMRIAESLNNLATIFSTTADYREALLGYLEALKICVKNRPSDHLDTATVLSNLADIFVNIRDLVTAMNYHIRSLEMRLRLLPKEHSVVALSIQKIGTVYYLQKDYDLALQQYSHALKIQEKTLPVGHRTANDLFSQIVSVYRANQDYEAAFNFCEQKLNQLREVVGEAHSSIGQLFCLIGNIYEDKKEDQEALTQYEKALMIFEKCVPSEQEREKLCHIHIGKIYYQRENYQTALVHHMKALEIARKIYLPEHPEIAHAQTNVGSIHLKLKNYNESIEYLEAALEIYVMKHFPDIQRIKNTQTLINEARLSSVNENYFS